MVKISPLIRTVFLISAREYFVENQFRLNQIALTATGEGRGRFPPSESGISEPGTPQSVGDPAFRGFSLDSIAVSVFADIFIELTNTVSDGNIQITILRLR